MTQKFDNQESKVSHFHLANWSGYLKDYNQELSDFEVYFCQRDLLKTIHLTDLADLMD